jgi:hypothetical protein
MTRFLLILALVGYVLYKVGGFFFKVGAASQQPRPQRRPQGNAHVDSTPKKDKDGHIKGGEYIDYEEVK